MIYTPSPAKILAVANTLADLPVTKKGIVMARGGEGVGAFGLYAELTIGDPIVHRHTRYFIVGGHMYASSRGTGASKAHWREKNVGTVDAAVVALRTLMTRPAVRQHGGFVLVELTADDISAVESGQVPGARYRAAYRLERDHRKFDWGQQPVEVTPHERYGKVLESLVA